ncbi:YrdB family protein [Rhizobium sp. No.120]
MKAIALGIRFALELCILASLVALAAHLAVPIPAQVLLGVAFCAATAAVWGTFLSPKRRYEIGAAGRVVLEAGIFVGAALILNYLDWSALAIALIVVAAADRIALTLIP